MRTGWAVICDRGPLQKFGRGRARAHPCYPTLRLGLVWGWESIQSLCLSLPPSQPPGLNSWWNPALEKRLSHLESRLSCGGASPRGQHGEACLHHLRKGGAVSSRPDHPAQGSMTSCLSTEDFPGLASVGTVFQSIVLGAADTLG